MVVDPARRGEVDADVAEWMAATADARRAATTYDYVADPADPSKVHFLQVWPDDAAFHAWLDTDEHRSGAAMQAKGYIRDGMAVSFDGCTGTSELHPPGG
jgi:quinol monooxygenase YgiN